jgi:DNA helicase-2/ATP-dependent DNA helicase PcrA
VNPSILSETGIIPDERQREAIAHVHGPMLVLAGAGTGKTTVLTKRVANLIREGHARPQEILALTYTENAAEEMRARVRQEVGGQNVDFLEAGTFHGWCYGLLYHHRVHFRVLDDKELWVYLRRRIRELKLKHYVRAANVGQFLDSLLDFMRRCQDDLVGPEQYAAYVARLEAGEIPLPRVGKSKEEPSREEILGRCHEIAHVFAKVEAMLRENNLGTFGHMITNAHALLKGDPALLEEVRQRNRFVLVDEFQDANYAQLQILQMLAGATGDIFAVGDPDQAIYRFRGASSEAFSLFLNSFPKARIVVLEKNRRSLSPILRCAHGIVNENPPVFAQKGSAIRYQRSPLESQREVDAKAKSENLAGSPVDIVVWAHKEVEAADLARSIQRKRKELRCAWSDFAVLYRQHNHREELVPELAERGIPFSIEALDVLDTPEVRDLVACLTAAVHPSDPASLFRVAALRQFGIHPTELRAAMRAVRREELDFRKTLARVGNGQAVLEAVDKVHAEVAKDGVSAAQAAEKVLGHFSLPRSLPVKVFLRFVDGWERTPMAESGTPLEFLEYLDLFGEARGTIPMPSSDEDAVRLMTAHAAKGLEFQHVAIIRGSSTSFPCAYREPLIDLPPELRASKTTVDDKELNEQEERRLLYVAMTRARDSLAIYAKQGFGKDPRPTKFLRDFMGSQPYQPYWRLRPAAAVQDRLFAEAEDEKLAIQRSNVAAWLLMPPPMGSAPALSASAIDIYEQCPLRFKLERDWNLPRDVAASLQYGASIHRVLHAFYTAQRVGREITDDTLLEMFRSDLNDAGIPDRYQYELYLRQGMEQLRQFLELARSSPPPDVLQTECRFELQVGPAKLVGRMDRIDRAGGTAITIVDYKTGKPRLQEDADKSLQLSLYALAARDVRGQRAERLIFYNLENNTPVVTTRSDSELDSAREKVLAVAGKIERQEFPAKPGHQCSFCPYRNLCPATEKIVFIPQKKSAGRAN